MEKVKILPARRQALKGEMIKNNNDYFSKVFKSLERKTAYNISLKLVKKNNETVEDLIERVLTKNRCFIFGQFGKRDIARFMVKHESHGQERFVFSFSNNTAITYSKATVKTLFSSKETQIILSVDINKIIDQAAAEIISEKRLAA
jgi:hypothetical protein